MFTKRGMTKSSFRCRCLKALEIQCKLNEQFYLHIIDTENKISCHFSALSVNINLEVLAKHINLNTSLNLGSLLKFGFNINTVKG
jgi:hypothetical protein